MLVNRRRCEMPGAMIGRFQENGAVFMAKSINNERKRQLRLPASLSILMAAHGAMLLRKNWPERNVCED